MNSVHTDVSGEYKATNDSLCKKKFSQLHILSGTLILILVQVFILYSHICLCFSVFILYQWKILSTQWRWCNMLCQRCKSTYWKNMVEFRQMSHIMRKHVFGDLRPGSTQTSLFYYRDQLESRNFGFSKIGIILSRQRTTEALIRLRGCTGLICVFVVRIWQKTVFLMTWLKYEKNSDAQKGCNYPKNWRKWFYQIVIGPKDVDWNCKPWSDCSFRIWV